MKTGDVLVQAGEVLYHVCPRLFFSFGCCCFFWGGLVMCLQGDTDVLIIKLLTTSYKAHPFGPCCAMQGLELCTLAFCCFCEVLSITGDGRFLLFLLIRESSNVHVTVMLDSVQATAFKFQKVGNTTCFKSCPGST